MDSRAAFARAEICMSCSDASFSSACEGLAGVGGEAVTTRGVTASVLGVPAAVPAWDKAARVAGVRAGSTLGGAGLGCSLVGSLFGVCVCCGAGAWTGVAVCGDDAGTCAGTGVAGTCAGAVWTLSPLEVACVEKNRGSTVATEIIAIRAAAAPNPIQRLRWLLLVCDSGVTT